MALGETVAMCLHFETQNDGKTDATSAGDWISTGYRWNLIGMGGNPLADIGFHRRLIHMESHISSRCDAKRSTTSKRRAAERNEWYLAIRSP